MVVGIALAGAAALGPLGAPGAAAASASASASATTGCRHDPEGRGAACISRSANGQTVRVRVGQKVEVDLSSTGLRWSGLREVGSHILRVRGALDQQAGKVSASYIALSKGRTMLQAKGAPVCAPGRPCPQFILDWQVHVDVSS
jgi:hypothetical protein